ncbi:hypothetical protein RN001_001072 [Aquatica leii]|uniref:K Homology domain-containing protein n=1 Tax=Aquatica leii TaxID=1421715 RepID=A0AAN7PKU3_9COLE|nr:hypothetical protein RN001_001072 [Aquatica leii]
MVGLKKVSKRLKHLDLYMMTDNWDDAPVDLTTHFPSNVTYNRGGGGRGRGFNKFQNSYNNSASSNSWKYPKNDNGSHASIEVPTKCVGRIIGKGGSKISDLQYESGAKIVVTKETVGDNTIVKIGGSEDEINKAKEMIEQLTIDRPPRQDRRFFNQSKSFLIIWKKSCKLLSIEFRLSIFEGHAFKPSNNKMSDWDESPSSHFSNNVTYNRGGGGRGRGYQNSYNNSSGSNSWRNPKNDNGNYVTMEVPTKCVGRIIGKGGSKITDLQYESGAKIMVTKETVGDNTIVKISGSEDEINKAQELIEPLTIDRPPRQDRRFFNQDPSGHNE